MKFTNTTLLAIFSAIRYSVITALFAGAINLASAATYGNFTYTDNGTEITITDYPTDAVGAIEIPAAIDGKPVTSIGDSAFRDCTNLTSITIPNSVTSIGADAFIWCSSLTRITIPSSVTSIGANAFDFCRDLTSITIPDSVTSIGAGAFSNCRSLVSVTIPDSVTSIEMSTFASCESLASITIPDSVTSIGVGAFIWCSSLTRITIPSSVTSIGSVTFYGCSSLTSINIPESVTSIEAWTFQDCSSLTSITIPDTVTSIEVGAFTGCSSLARASFHGNAPEPFGTEVFSNTHIDFRIYYFEDATGFTSPTWYSYNSVNMGARTSTKSWLVENSISYDTDAETDPNSDGVSLLMAYALNLDPNQNLSASMPQPAITEDQMQLEFYSGSEGVTYLVETSSNLVDWNTTGVILSDPDADQMRTATISRSGSKQFMRLVVND